MNSGPTADNDYVFSPLIHRDRHSWRAEPDIRGQNDQSGTTDDRRGQPLPRCASCADIGASDASRIPNSDNSVPITAQRFVLSADALVQFVLVE